MLHRLDDDFTIALFPHVEGRSGDFGDDLRAPERHAVVELLAELHAAMPPAGLTEPVIGLPGSQATLIDLVDDTAGPWTAGPYGEPAHAWLQEHAGEVRALVERVADGARAIRERDPHLVLTHGEPHPGNVMVSASGLRLIDWDTIGLAPPERDLWHVESPAGDAAAHYEAVTGRSVDRAAIALYREQWILDDLAISLHDLRSPHERNADTDALWRWLAELQLGG
jgi:spectinomycin phosphotransferase